MAVRLSPTARIGLALVLIPLTSLGGWAAWSSTRVWEPLSTPISLARGHFRAEFDINVESLYAMQVELNTDRELGRPWCPDQTRSCDAVNLAGVAWSVSTGKRTLARGTGEPANSVNWWYRALGTFQCGKGRYVLNLDVLEDQSRLNFYEPHLVIYEAGGKDLSTSALGALSLLALVLCGPVGASMTMIAAIQWRQEKLAAFWKTHPLTQPGPAGDRFLPRSVSTRPSHRTTRKTSVTTPLLKLSTHSLILVLTFLILWAAMVVLRGMGLLLPTGLRVRTLPLGITAPPAPGIQPLVVRVAGDWHGARPNLYIDSQLINWEDLGTVLRKELRQRPPDWPVYVQGDPELEWRQVAEAIDEIRGEQAEVVLLTSAKSKK